MARRPHIIGLGGTIRDGSSSEKALRLALNWAESRGATCQLFAGSDLMLPMYDPAAPALPAKAAEIIAALRSADGVILSSPCYHGGISGLLKNAIDYTEEMRADERVYFEGRAVGLICCGFGNQGPSAGLNALRAITHALRGWPTPLGVAVNSAEVRFENGTCSDDKILNQLQAMADQVVGMLKIAA